MWGQCPMYVWISVRMDIQQPLWETLSSFWPTSCWIILTLYLTGISHVLGYAHCLFTMCSKMGLAALFLHSFIRQLKEVTHSVLNLHAARLNKPCSPSPSLYVLCSPLWWTWKRVYALCNYLSYTWKFFWNLLNNCHRIWLSSENAFCQAQVKHLWRTLVLLPLLIMILVLTELLRF